MSDITEGHSTYHGYDPRDVEQFDTWEEQMAFAERHGDAGLVQSLLRRKPRHYTAVRSGGMRLPDEDLGTGTDKLNRLMSGKRQ